MSGCMALSVMAVSTSVSPFLMDEEDTDMFMTSAPSRLPASSNEDWVRVEASKKRFTCVRPRRTVRFLSTWRLSSKYSSDRWRRPVMSAAERPSMPSKCRWPRTKVDFDVIKARAIGGDGRGGKGQSPGGELSPDLYLVVIPGRCEASNPESRDSPVRNSAPVVWSFGPSRNDRGERMRLVRPILISFLA